MESPNAFLDRLLTARTSCPLPPHPGLCRKPSMLPISLGGEPWQMEKSNSESTGTYQIQRVLLLPAISCT